MGFNSRFKGLKNRKKTRTYLEL